MYRDKLWLGAIKRIGRMLIGIISTMGSDRCVDCSRKVTSRQHALQCDTCDRWQHRVCNTGISVSEYRQMMKSECEFTCTICKQEDETPSGRADSTHLSIESASSSRVDYGEFDVSLIPANSSTGTQLNASASFQVPPPPSPEQPTDNYQHADLTASFDVTRRSNDDPSEVRERSIAEPDLSDSILPETPVTYTVVESGSQRNQRKLVSSDGYEYTKKVKAVARQDMTKTAHRIVEDVMLDTIEPTDHQLPKVSNLRRLANQIREDLRPQEPRDLDFVVDKEFLQCDDFLIGDLQFDGQQQTSCLPLTDCRSEPRRRN